MNLNKLINYLINKNIMSVETMEGHIEDLRKNLNDMLDKAVEEMDTNKDGFINMREMLSYIKIRTKYVYKSLLGVWRYD